MNDIRQLSREELFQLLVEREAGIAERDTKLAERDTQIAEQAAQLAEHATVAAQFSELSRVYLALEAKHLALEIAHGLLQEKHALLIQEHFGRSSERYLADPEALRHDLQPELPAETESGEPSPSEDALRDAVDGLRDACQEVASDEAAAPETQPNRRAPAARRAPRRGHPEHLRRDVRDVLIDDAAQRGLNLIGYDETETLVQIPAQLYVRRLRYAKYVDPRRPELGVFSARRAPGLVAGDLYDPSVAAEIIVAKHARHLPIYRQQDIFAAHGWTPARSTLLNIKSAAHAVLAPLVRSIIDRLIRAGGVIGADETPLTLLVGQTLGYVAVDDPKRERCEQHLADAAARGLRSIKAQMWVYRSESVPLVAFDFDVQRTHAGLDQFLIERDFHGTVVADCWSGYVGIEQRSAAAIIHAGCHSHVRRKFVDATDSRPRLVQQVLELYQQLYDIEDEIKSAPAEVRLAVRQTRSRGVWDAIRALLETPAFAGVLPKEQLGKAMSYLRNHVTALEVFLSDPSVPIDNNACERLMKYVALGRKNWLFIGSLRAGGETADLMTLVHGAQRNELDPHAYLQGVLTRLLEGETDYESLHPDRWRESHPDDVRPHREEERRDRADRKQRDRAQRRAARRK